MGENSSNQFKNEEIGYFSLAHSGLQQKMQKCSFSSWLI